MNPRQTENKKLLNIHNNVGNAATLEDINLRTEFLNLKLKYPYLFDGSYPNLCKKS